MTFGVAGGTDPLVTGWRGGQMAGLRDDVHKRLRVPRVSGAGWEAQIPLGLPDGGHWGARTGSGEGLGREHTQALPSGDPWAGTRVAIRM